MAKNNLQENSDIARKILEIEDSKQLLWLHGFLTATLQLKGNGIPSTDIASTLVDIPEQESIETGTTTITVLFGSHTGNGKKLSGQLKSLAESKGLKINLQDMFDYKPKDLKNEEVLLLIVSTHGEGDPPVAAEELHEYIYSSRAPKLDNLKYSVLALGDKSYVHFCKTGIDFDTRLEELGATRLIPRVDCDVDFEEPAGKWIEDLLTKVSETVQTTTKQSAAKSNGLNGSTVPQPATDQYTKKNPGKVSVAAITNLNGRGSDKATLHVELVAEDGNIDYKPGDSLGIIPKNPDQLVEVILKTAKFSGNERIYYKDNEYVLKDLLKSEVEITTLNRDTLSKYQELVSSNELGDILDNSDKLSAYIYGRDIVDMITDFPARFSPNQFVATLRKIQPRLYSIASSKKQYDDEVHLTVGVVKFNQNNRLRYGACSNFISTDIQEGAELEVYVEKNELFKLPSDPAADVIMIGPGTGIAPFRAFLQEREADDAPGKNWLFFGDQHFTTDFLYQTEWQKWRKSELLTDIDVAFSRDQESKVYVQHKMLQKSKELYDWLQSGAYIYVCGDKNAMAKDVYHTLISIIEKEGGMTVELATEYIKGLRKQKRYLEDVY